MEKMKTMDKRIDEIRSRCEAATPGPWEICLGSGNHVCTGIKADGDNGTVFISDCLPDYALSNYALSIASEDYQGNVNFIAHAREDIPFLLSELERLRALAEASRDGRCVVLPCKVGDTVYGYPFCWAEETISERGILEWKVACIHCSVNKAGKTRATVRATVWRQYNGNEYAYITEDIPFEDFGKTVFLTREEAEATLRGEEG